MALNSPREIARWVVSGWYRDVYDDGLVIRHQIFARSAKSEERRAMQVLLKTNEPVLLSFVESLMREAEIAIVVADRNMSIMEGSVGIFPRRVLVDSSHMAQARRVLIEAGLEEWIFDDE